MTHRLHRRCIDRQLGGIVLRRSGEIHRRQYGTVKTVVNLIAPVCAGGLERTFVRAQGRTVIVQKVGAEKRSLRRSGHFDPTHEREFVRRLFMNRVCSTDAS